MVDAMAPGRAHPGRASGRRSMVSRASPDLRRASALVLVGILLSAGCGSASGQTGRTPTAVQAAATGSARPANGGPSGIGGQTVAIVCGGVSSDQGCPQHPVVATIDVLRMPSRRHIATVHTDSRGHFRLNLAPGSYELRAHSSIQLVAPPTTARVLPRQIKHTVITFASRHPLPVAPGSASG